MNFSSANLILVEEKAGLTSHLQDPMAKSIMQ